MPDNTTENSELIKKLSQSTDPLAQEAAKALLKADSDLKETDKLYTERGDLLINILNGDDIGDMLQDIRDHFA